MLCLAPASVFLLLCLQPQRTLLPPSYLPEITYTITDLGVLHDYPTASYAAGLNNRGQVVGMSLFSRKVGRYGVEQRYHAFVWSQGILTDLGASAPGNSTAYAVNDSGQVVGTAAFSGLTGHAALWQNSGVTDLGVLPGGLHSSAGTINNAGLIGGRSESDAYGTLHGVFWSGATITDLGCDQVPVKINALGHAVGSGHLDPVNSPDEIGAWIRTGNQEGSEEYLVRGLAYATGINDFDTVVGYRRNEPGYSFDAFVWRTGTLTWLPRLNASDTEVQAFSINRQGDIVGVSGVPVLWKKASPSLPYSVFSIQNLLPADSGWTALTVTSVNDNGQMAGYGSHNGASRAFLITPHRWAVPLLAE